MSLRRGYGGKAPIVSIHEAKCKNRSGDEGDYCDSANDAFNRLELQTG